MKTHDVELTDRLFHLCFVLYGQLAQLAAAHDLSVIQMRLLGILRDHEPTMQQLAQHLDLEKSSLSGLIDRAEARGLVERVASEEDRRSIRVRITRSGHKQVQTVGKKLAYEVAKLTGHLGDTEKAALVELVGRIVQHIDLPE